MINKNFWKNKRVFITGHTGFKGSWLSSILTSWGAEVTGYSNAIEDHHQLFKILKLENKLDHVLGDLRDHSHLKNILNEKKPEIVFHFGAQALVLKSYENPIETIETNILGTSYLLASLPDSVKVVINVTTDKVYENKERQNAFLESDRLGGDDLYSASKSSSELITHAFRESFFKNKDVKIVTARAGNVIGGGDYSPNRLFPDLWKSIESKKILKLRNPTATRPWQHVLDCCHGYLLWAESLEKQKHLASSALNFSPDQPASSVIELVEFIQKTYPELKLETLIEKNDIQEKLTLTLCSDLAKKEINWSTKWDQFQSVKKTIEWYIAKNKVQKTQEQIDEFFI